MTIAARVGRGPSHPVPVEVARFVERESQGRQIRSPEQGEDLRRAVSAAFRARERRELADLDVRRSIFELRDAGVSQRKIAELVGLSQPEVSRRLKRRELTPPEQSPREVILRRAAGLLSSEEMMESLRSMPMTSTPPARAAGFDASATSTGSARQLASALQSGLLTADEYEQLRTTIQAVRRPLPA